MPTDRIRWHEAQAAWHAERAAMLRAEERGANLPRALPRRAPGQASSPGALPASFHFGTSSRTPRRAKSHFPKVPYAR